MTVPVQPSRILIGDDEERNCLLLAEMVERLGHECELARDGYAALARLPLGFDLVILDVQMPGMDGYQVTRAIREQAEFADLPILIATGLTDYQQRINAVAAGASDFVNKPVDLTELRLRVEALLRVKQAQDAIKRHQQELEVKVEQRTAALRRALEQEGKLRRQMHEAHVEVLHLMAAACEHRDDDTGAHIHRMSRYCELLARVAGLLPQEIETIRLASPLHDVGKIGLPDSILLKPGKLTAEEFDQMKQHTVMGERILSAASSELVKAGRLIAISHHERWDGSGYPHGQAGEAIPLWGRICAVADVFDALTSQRPYKRAFGNGEAFAILSEGRGQHFDPRLVDLFIQHRTEVESIQHSQNLKPMEHNPMKKILVIDDDPNMTAMIREVLETGNYQLTTVGSGFRGMMAVKQERFDLILLDINMPGLDGFETLTHLEELQPGVPVIIESGAPEVTERAEELKGRVRAVLAKPFTPQRLLALVRQTLNE